MWHAKQAKKKAGVQRLVNNFHVWSRQTKSGEFLLNNLSDMQIFLITTCRGLSYTIEFLRLAPFQIAAAFSTEFGPNDWISQKKLTYISVFFKVTQNFKEAKSGKLSLKIPEIMEKFNNNPGIILQMSHEASQNTFGNTRECLKYHCIGDTRKSPINTQEIPGNTQAIPRRYPRDTLEIPWRYQEDTLEIPRRFPGDFQEIPRRYPDDTHMIPRRYPEDTHGDS